VFHDIIGNRDDKLAHQIRTIWGSTDATPIGNRALLLKTPFDARLP
jgi:hypothetical protein